MPRDFGLDSVVNALPLFHLLDWSLDSLDGLLHLGVGDHDSLLDLTGACLLDWLHLHSLVLAINGLIFANSDLVHNLLILSASASEIVGTAAVTLEGSGFSSDGLAHTSRHLLAT